MIGEERDRERGRIEERLGEGFDPSFDRALSRLRGDEVLIRLGEETGVDVRLSSSSSSSSSTIPPNSIAPCPPTTVTLLAPPTGPQLFRLLDTPTPKPIIGLVEKPLGGRGLRAVPAAGGGAVRSSPGSSFPREMTGEGAETRPSSASRADCRVCSGDREPSSSNRPRSLRASRTCRGSLDQAGREG